MVPLRDVASCAQTSWLVQEDGNHHITESMSSILWGQVPAYSIQEILSQFQTLAGREIEVRRIAEGGFTFSSRAIIRK